jgi:uncharacterized protein (TIGR03437 family)
MIGPDAKRTVTDTRSLLGAITFDGGLYQINVTIPKNAPIDSAMPLAISTAEVSQ